MSDRDADWPARLRLDPTAFIAPGAVVVGEVTLGARSSVWFNTVVRGDTAAVRVGEETNIQDNSTVHVDEGQPAVIGARVTVGHRAIVHGCVVEDECLIGMGAVVLSGARVGQGSLVGAGALVREGQLIAPGSLVVGAPARVVGPVSAQHREAILGGTRHYVALSRSYLARGFARPHPPAHADTGITARERGPMSFLEWGQLLAVLAESPDWAADRLERNAEAAWRRAPGPGAWSALEALCHLRDADRDVFLPRLERLLSEERPEIPDVDMTGWESARRYHEQDPAGVLAEWSEARRRLLARLAPLSRTDWARVGFHSVRGPCPLAEMVRTWGDHDLSHRRQMAAALGEFA
ncbi:MAG: DinB family protein [Candidatus Eisenbacteria bacterium]|nr:DinB family protein [Candidatus Eisenbacteria bacterium]